VDLYEHYQHINKQLREAVLAKQPAEHLRFKRATIKKNMPQRLASVAEVPEYTTELDTIIEIMSTQRQKRRVTFTLPPFLGTFPCSFSGRLMAQFCRALLVEIKERWQGTTKTP